MRRLLPWLVGLGACLALLLLALVPGAAWRVLAPRPLGVVVLDKTVPDTTYRGHRGVIWVLNHLKLVRPGSLSPYHAAEDYVGFVPLTGRAWSVRPFPPNPGAVRVVYVADTYGVTAADLGERDTGAASRRLVGGLSTGDLDALEGAARGGATLVAEFNLAAAPTEDTTRSRAEALFGMQSTGWTGRRSTDLATDVPRWTVALWERGAGAAWAFSGRGVLLVHRDGRVVVLSGEDLVGDGLEILPTSAGRALGMRPAPAPQGWFDLVLPRGATTLALYRWDLAPRGDSLLAAAGVPLVAAAAVAHRRGAARTYYLAGDFANVARLPRWVRVRGGAAFMRLLPGWWMPADEAFFWRGYVPLLTSILDWSAGS